MSFKQVMLLAAVTGAVALSNAAHAAQIAITGYHNLGQIGSVGPVGIGQASQQSFSVGSGNDFVSGTVRYSNTVADGEQCLELTLTNFTFRADGNVNKTISITVVQDFVTAGDIAGTTASHTMNGWVNFGQAGQLATGYTDSTHESVLLPRVAFNPNAVLSNASGQPVINRGQGTPSNVTVSGTYRMMTTYVFTLNAAGGVVSVHFPDSIVDNACLVLVPVQHVTAGAFAALGFAFIRSRRAATKAAG